MMTLAFCFGAAIFIGLPEKAHANVFLGRYAEDSLSEEGEEASEDFREALLVELERVLGSEHRAFTERRISRIEEVLRPMVRAMPQNKHGKLEHGAVSYVLYRLFVLRHGWSIRGLEPEGDSKWNTTTPLTLFTHKIPEFVQGVMEKRMGQTGLGVHEIAVLAATFEHLVHKEALERLRLAYKIYDIEVDDVMAVSEASAVLETYMIIYILWDGLAKKGKRPSVELVKKWTSNVERVYPTWPATQTFLHDVKDSVLPERDHMYFSDVSTVVEEIGERYGRWQDHECRELKDTLLAVEDTGPGGAGRVRVADFYGMALNEGKWQFSESIAYLRNLGALDESDPNSTRVLIANYIYAPSNCLASSNFYSVCCIDECVNLLADLEAKLAKSHALPTEIINIVSSLVSISQPSRRELSPWLVQRLEDVAAQHSGLVPLHGRLFAQWMHFAYPRECRYPHVSGSLNPLRISDLVVSKAKARAAIATAEDMKKHVESTPARLEHILNASAHEELTMLSMEEELVVWSPLREGAGTRPISLLLRASAFVASIATLSASLVRQANVHLKSQPCQDKYYV